MSKFGIIYFCTLAAVSMVLSNPLMQSMPFQPCQQQNCPNCQQNPFLNLPIEIPLTFAPQQLPAPQQPLTGCNQCSRPVVTNQNCNLCSRPALADQGVANEANHQIINKVLSNPLVQAIMKNYKYQNPAQNVNRNINPQVVNNYFIIPSEVLLNETRKVEEKNAAVKQKQQTKIQNRIDPNQAKRPNQASQWKPQCIVPGRPQNHRVQPYKPKVQTIPVNNVASEQKQKARIQNPKEKPVCKKNNRVTIDKTNQCTKTGVKEEKKIPVQKCKDAVKDFFDEYYENEEINKPQTKRSEKDEGSRSFETGFEHKPIDQELSPPKQTNYKQKPKKATKNNERPHIPSQMITQENIKNSAEIEKRDDLSNQLQKDYIGEPIDFVDVKQLPEESRKTRNPDDVIIRNVKSKYPDMPEKLVRELLFQMKQQLQNTQPQRQMNHHSRPYNNFYPMNYNPYYQRPHYPWFPVQQWAGISNATTNNMVRNPGRKPKSKRNKKPKQIKNQNELANDIISDGSKLKTVTEQTTEKTENETIVKTTEKSNTDTTNFETPQDTYNPETVEPEKNTNEPENTTPYFSSKGNAYPDPRLRQLGAEDEVPSIDDNGIGWIEDYYPDFSKDTFFDDEFYESHPEYYEEEIQRNERKIQSDAVLNYKHLDKRREMLKKYGRRRLYGNNILNQKPLKKEESTYDFEDKSEETVFKTPPGLETPDFKTIKIKEYRDSEFLRPRYFSEDYDYSNFNDHEDISNDKKSPTAEIKSSTYSYSKIPYDSSSVKPSNVIRDQKDKTKAEIETDFANSKIVRYGNVKDFRSIEDTTQESPISQEDIWNKYYATDNDGISIVMAQSYLS